MNTQLVQIKISPTWPRRMRSFCRPCRTLKPYGCHIYAFKIHEAPFWEKVGLTNFLDTEPDGTNICHWTRRQAYSAEASNTANDLTLSQPNSHTYSDAKNVRECSEPTVELCADASVAMFTRWLYNCMQAQTASNNVRVDTSTSSRIQCAMKLLQLQHVRC